MRVVYHWEALELFVSSVCSWRKIWLYIEPFHSTGRDCERLRHVLSLDSGAALQLEVSAAAGHGERWRD